MSIITHSAEYDFRSRNQVWGKSLNDNDTRNRIQVNSHIFCLSQRPVLSHLAFSLQLWAKTSRCRGHFTWKTTAPTLDAPRFAKIQRLKWNNDEQRNQYVAAWVLRDPKRLVSHSVNYKLPPRECPGPSSVGHLHGYGSHSGNWRVSTWATDHFMAM